MDNLNSENNNIDNKIVRYIKERNNRRKENLKYDFMPNMLEIIEKPAHIGGKVIIWTFFVFLVTAVIWAAVSKVDAVVTATGLVIPVGNVSVVQTVESGVITDICVENGQYVNTGDVLAIIDSEIEAIDEQSIEAEIKKLESENDIYQMVLDGVSIEEVNLDEYDEEIRTDIEYIIRKEKYFLKSLDEESSYAEDLREQHNIEILGQIVENNEGIKEMSDSLRKVQISIDNQQIKAGTSGYITDLDDGMKGQIVSAGEKLMTIVPDNTEMEIQCYIKDSDIADVSVGKEAVIKLSAYPHSDYGTLKGNITYVSENTVSNENMNNMYFIKVSVENTNNNIKLKSGMTASVEVNVKKRSVLDYFLDPIKGTIGDSMKEK